MCVCVCVCVCVIYIYIYEKILMSSDQHKPWEQTAVAAGDEEIPSNCAEEGGPVVSAEANEVADTEGRDERMEEGEIASDTDEEVNRLASTKYQDFLRTCGELLDPSQ